MKRTYRIISYSVILSDTLEARDIKIQHLNRLQKKSFLCMEVEFIRVCHYDVKNFTLNIFISPEGTP